MIFPSILKIEKKMYMGLKIQQDDLLIEFDIKSDDHLGIQFRFNKANKFITNYVKWFYWIFSVK